MFGKNKRYKINFISAPQYAINSIFHTIQGEGPYAGTPAIFLRMAHCNLACTWCDTEFETSTQMHANDVLIELKKQIDAHPTTRLLVITGGEPLLQDISIICRLLLIDYPHYTIQIETAGTAWQPALQPLLEQMKVTLVCSPKTPTIHKNIAWFCQDWKYIVKEGWVADDDGLPDMPTQDGVTGRTKLARPQLGTVYVQPVDEHDAVANKANAVFAAELAMKHGYKLSLQIHKIVDLL
jgi:7-carboxy-7-deazaguanine synthase